MMQVVNEKMTPENFVYWLQGFFEILEASDEGNVRPVPIELTAKQVDVIRRHLDYVFTHGHLPQQTVTTVAPMPDFSLFAKQAQSLPFDGRTVSIC